MKGTDLTKHAVEGKKITVVGVENIQNGKCGMDGEPTEEAFLVAGLRNGD